MSTSPSTRQLARPLRWRRLEAGLIWVLILTAAPAATADEEEPEAETRWAFSSTTTLKLSGLASRAPHDDALFPDTFGRTGSFRFRYANTVMYDDWLTAESAHEHRVLWTSPRATGGGLVRARDDAPYRLRQLQWDLYECGDSLTHRHEIDRASMAMHGDWGEIKIGRQAVGLGRGVLFSAVDVFAPFSPLEFDRDWRRGVDATRFSCQLGPTSSAELLGVFGKTWEQSALLGRIRGYVGEVDGEFIAGKRAEDTMVAAVVSGVVAEAEVHAEAAGFWIDEEHPDGGLFGSDRFMGKAVLGTSYTFDIRNGLTAMCEYHFSSFGVRDVRDAGVLLATPGFQQRFLRGDSQILARHAVAGQLSYPFNEAVSGSLTVFASPTDGSGLVFPAVVWDASDHVRMIVSGYMPWGNRPRRGVLGSQYGGTPWTLFVQLSLSF
jgi:hypothetical protein